jgi:hypothetical protein
MPEWMNELTAQIFERNLADRSRSQTDPGFMFTQAMEDRRVLLELLGARGATYGEQGIGTGSK